MFKVKAFQYLNHGLKLDERDHLQFLLQSDPNHWFIQQNPNIQSIKIALQLDGHDGDIALVLKI